MADNSSDDDVPISKLKNSVSVKKEAPVSVKKEADSDDDDLPIASLANKRPPTSSGKPPLAPKRKSVAADSDDDDDIPLAKLAKASSPKLSVKVKVKTNNSPKKEKATAPPKKNPNPAKTKAAAAAKKKVEKVVDTSVVSKDSSTISGLYSSSTKGQMVNKLLCRWWYAIEWPNKADIKDPPLGYEALEGYPGVNVCVKGDKIGSLLDNRNEAACPNFINLIHKSTVELKELLITALENQLQVLQEHEGEGVNDVVEAAIRKDLKWAQKVNSTAADKFDLKIKSKVDKLRRQSHTK